MIVVSEAHREKTPTPDHFNIHPDLLIPVPHCHGLIDNFECLFSISDSEDIHIYDDDTYLH